MINAFGYYASAKGMVLVPDLSGLSSSAAIAALSASGLEYSLGEDINTSNSSFDNLIAEQSPIANTLVDYSTVVSFRLYNYVATPTPTPSPPPACSGGYVTSVSGTSTSWGCPSGTANVTYWYDECSQLVDEVFVSCVPPTPTPAPPTPTPTPCPGCSGPKPFPDCFCACGTWGC
jgi:hypothetical protein